MKVESHVKLDTYKVLSLIYKKLYSIYIYTTLHIFSLKGRLWSFWTSSNSFIWIKYIVVFLYLCSVSPRAFAMPDKLADAREHLITCVLMKYNPDMAQF